MARGYHMGITAPISRAIKLYDRGKYNSDYPMSNYTDYRNASQNMGTITENASSVTLTSRINYAYSSISPIHPIYSTACKYTTNSMSLKDISRIKLTGTLTYGNSYGQFLFYLYISQTAPSANDSHATRYTNITLNEGESILDVTDITDDTPYYVGVFVRTTGTSESYSPTYKPYTIFDMSELILEKN